MIVLLDAKIFNDYATLIDSGAPARAKRAQWSTMGKKIW